MLYQPYSRLDFRRSLGPPPEESVRGRRAGSFPKQRLVSLTLFRQGFLGLPRTRSGAQGPAFPTVHDTATTFARFSSFAYGQVRENPSTSLERAP